MRVGEIGGGWCVSRHAIAASNTVLPRTRTVLALSVKKRLMYRAPPLSETGKRRSLMARWAEYLDRAPAREGKDAAATASAPIPLRAAAW